MSSLKRRLQNLEVKAGAGRPEVVIYILGDKAVEKVARGRESILTMAEYERELQQQERTGNIIIIDDVRNGVI